MLPMAVALGKLRNVSNVRKMRGRMRKMMESRTYTNSNSFPDSDPGLGSESAPVDI